MTAISTNAQKPLKVVFCTVPSVYSDIVLQEIICSDSVQLVGIVASTRILRKKGWGWWDAVLLVRKTGLLYALYLWIVTTLYTLLRHLTPHNQISQYLSRNKNSVPVFKTRDINALESRRFIDSCQPDFLLSAHFNQLIGPELLAMPPHGCLNIHPGQLPAYKGVDPVLYALSRGEQQLGVTLHLQDEGFDTGAIIASTMVQIQQDDSLLSLNCILFKKGVKLLLDATRQNGFVLQEKQQEKSDRYDSWPDKSVISQVRRSGRKLLSLSYYIEKISSS